jgi:hypothetical protein
MRVTRVISYNLSEVLKKNKVGIELECLPSSEFSAGSRALSSKNYACQIIFGSARKGQNSLAKPTFLLAAVGTWKHYSAVA